MPITFEGILAVIGIFLFFLFMIFILPFERARKNLEDEINTRKLFAEQQRVAEEEYKRRRRDEEEYEISQKAKGLIKITRDRKEYWVTQEKEREWKFIDVDLENNFQKLTPRQFEITIQDLFIKMNYETTLTNFTGDYGADLIVKRNSEILVVQCKKYMKKHKVGAPEVQRTLGSMYRYNASKAILVTTSDFTNQAKNQALKAPIELWNKRKLREQFMNIYLTNSCSRTN